MRQYFAMGKLEPGSLYQFTNEQLHHLKDVLRVQSGDIIRLVDNENRPFMAKIVFEGKKPQAEVLYQLEEDKTNREVVLCAALIKRDKWEWLIQKAAELGADRIVPVITERTVIDLKEGEADKKLIRWNKIALEACQQSNRTTICEVDSPISLKEISQYKRDINLAAYEKEDANRLIDAVKDGSICVMIGPEGGFSSKEIEFLKAEGFASVSLGRNILRAETAAIYVLSVIGAVSL